MWSAARSATATRAARREDRRGARAAPALPQARAAFEIHNSPLTENARSASSTATTSRSRPRLVIWEAQYGDFINGAQTMIDEFVVSARAKWGLSRRWCCCCRTRTKGRGPITPARGPSASCSSRPTSTCASPTARPRRSTSTCSGGRRAADRGPAAADRADAEEPAAAPDGGVGAARAGRRARDGDPDPMRPQARGGRPPRARLLRQGVRRSHVERASGERPDVAICRLEQLYPYRCATCGRCSTLPEAGGGRLGAGRAGEHGRVGLHPSAPGGCRRRAPRAPCCAAAQREPRGRIGRATRDESAGPRRKALGASPASSARTAKKARQDAALTSAKG
jgi:hypothetical protein